MKQLFFQRGLSLALALLLVAAVLPLGALAAEKKIVELVATDVTLDETRYEYTGEEIRPNVTVRVRGKLLTLNKHYTLTYRDNVQVGTATVVVTGIATKGYTGTVEHPFYIEPKHSEEDSGLTTILGTDVTIDGTEFTYTGQEIRPAVIVTLGNKVLTAGEEYTLSYAQNIQPGTASVTVTGVEDKGYTGSVTIQFTIVEGDEEPEESRPDESQPDESQPDESQPDESQPDESQPDESQPEESRPEESQPEESQPEESKPVAYKITKGDGASWHKNSGKDLSFTTDSSKKVDAVLVDGKTVNTKYYTATGNKAVVTLKNTLLQGLDLGKHTITIRFDDGEAAGSFTISAPADETNPKTGDSFALHAWTALLFVSLTGLAGATFVCGKKLRK